MIVVFTLSTLWLIRMRGLWKLPDRKDWLWEKLVLVLLGGVMLSKSLIHFSVDVFPPCCVTWNQTMVRVMKTMAISFKRTCACTLVFSASNLAAGHCQLTPPLETPGNSQASLVILLWGHCSFLLGPGAHRFCLCLPRVCFHSHV